MPEILIVGHISIDRIKNIHGERVQAGGAALYAAMGARTICRDVGILSAIGEDYRFHDVLSLFKSSIIRRVKGRSTSFFIIYDRDWNATYKEVFTGPGSKITTRDLMRALKYNVRAVHIAPMNPPKVEKMIKEIKSRYKNIIVSLNSSIHYFNKVKNRRAILNAASMSDFFILNEKELHALTEIEVVSEAMKLIKSKVVVLTLGEIGTLIKSEGNIEFVPAMAAITKNIVDVTGAGDTWAGSFLASYLKSNSWSKAVSFASVISAIKCTSWNFEKIMNLNFNSIEEVYEFAIALKEKSKQLTLIDAWKNKSPSSI